MALRTQFDEQLDELNNSLIKMGGSVEKAIKNAIKSLTDKDTALAHKVIDEDEKIDEMEIEIEKLCLDIILRQQPVAGDLRFVTSVLKIVTDLERISDYAIDISEMAIYMEKHEYIEKLTFIPQMAEEIMKTLIKSLDSFIKEDIKLANEVIKDDDKIDELFLSVKEKLIGSIERNPKNADQAMDFMTIATDLIRIERHSINIAEWVVFGVTGKHKDNRIM